MHRLILPHQREAFEHLCSLAKTTFSTSRVYPIMPRSNVLVIGPSGSGKSFLARAVATEISVQIFQVSVADWIVMGAGEKGAEKTWPAIIHWLIRREENQGGIIFVDELHHACGDSAWERFVRVEIFSLLDKKFPATIQIMDEDDVRIPSSTMREALRKLTSNTMIIGGGAFQEIWKKSPSKIGFRNENAKNELPSLNLLSQHLPRELINRFRSRIVVLRPLEMEDYEMMLKRVAEQLPEQLRKNFLEKGLSRIAGACEQNQGSRFLEELLMDVLIDERERREKDDYCIKLEEVMQ